MIVRFKAGLGNQMFQYAFYKSLKLKYKFNNVFADFSYFTNANAFGISMIDNFNVDIQTNIDEIDKTCYFNHNQKPHSISYRIHLYLEKTINKAYYFEKDMLYKNPESLKKYKYLDGYWQSWRYMEGLESILREEFTPKNTLSVIFNKLSSKIQKENAIFIGIRRGDYLSNPKVKKKFLVCDEKYFIDSTIVMSKFVLDPVFYVFSDDIEWVKANIDFKISVSYIDRQYMLTDVEELLLMSLCKHAIISNSTYHWWAAWLIKNQNKIVIRPNLWFGDGTKIDIYPPEWITIKEDTI